MRAGAGLRGAVKEVARRGSAVARLQAELVKAEFASTGKNAGVGAALAIGAAFIGVFAFALLTALLVVALAIALPLWLSILIILVVYVIVLTILGLLARNRFRRTKGAPLSAEQARLTASALGLSRSGDRVLAPSPPAPARPGNVSRSPTPAAQAPVASQGDGGPGVG